MTIQLAATGYGATATITYTHTSLGPEGDTFVDGFSKDFYKDFMQDWQVRLNDYLLRHKT